jgi:hypothetical protein
VAKTESFRDDDYSGELATAAKLQDYLITCLASIEPSINVSCQVSQHLNKRIVSCEIRADETAFADAQVAIESEVRVIARADVVISSHICYEAIVPAIAKYNDDVEQLFRLDLLKEATHASSAAPVILAVPAVQDTDPNFGVPTADIEHVILLIHGIRDIGAWQSNVSRNLVQRGTVVEQIRYGYYPEVRFLFPFDLSSRPVQKVLKRIRAIRNLYPNARLSVIAHSFGTYVFLRALKEDSDLEFWKIIFCGSVADDEFEWSELKRRVGQRGRATKDFILNDCGTGDAWPILGTAFGWHYGMAGATGFSEGFVTNRFHRAIGGTKGGHGLYFDPEFVRKKWRPFLIDDVAPSHGDGKQGEHLCWCIQMLYHSWARFFCKICALAIWIALAVFLVMTFLGSVKLCWPLIQRMITQ